MQKHLVQAAEACKKEVDLLCGRYVVDAKSMLGVFSLPCFDDVKNAGGGRRCKNFDSIFGTGKCYQNGGKLRWN